MSVKIFKPKAEMLREGRCPVCYSPLTTTKQVMVDGHIETRSIPEQCPYGHGDIGRLQQLCAESTGGSPDMKPLMDENGNDLY